MKLSQSQPNIPLHKGRTQESFWHYPSYPKCGKIKDHSSLAMVRWINRWSIVLLAITYETPIRQNDTPRD